MLNKVNVWGEGLDETLTDTRELARQFDYDNKQSYNPTRPSGLLYHDDEIPFSLFDAAINSAITDFIIRALDHTHT